MLNCARILTSWWRSTLCGESSHRAKGLPSLEVVKRFRRQPGQTVTLGPLEQQLMARRDREGCREESQGSHSKR